MSDYFLETQHHEWILTNKNGSYALGTGNLINQRKYHTLLTASDNKLNRNALLNSIEESIEWRGEKIFLDSNNYENCIYPEGFLHLVKSWLRPYPVFLYSSLPHNNDILIRKSIMMDSETNTILIRYKNLSKHLIHMRLRPKLSMVNHHFLNHPHTLNDNDFSTSIAQEYNLYGAHIQRISNGTELFCMTSKGKIKEDFLVYNKIFYPWESMLGYDCTGDLASPYRISLQLDRNEEVDILFSDQTIDSFEDMRSRIEERYSELPKARDYPDNYKNFDILNLDFNDNDIYSRNDVEKLLEFSLQDFITENDIIAGYPWFGPWGRDSILVLSAMIKQPKFFDHAEKIIFRYNEHIKNGLIPNMFPETGSYGNYESVDSSLYYIMLLRKYAMIKNKITVCKDILKITENIILNYLNDDQEMFFIDDNNLINIKAKYASATWMDVKINGQAVTPRDGAPVEINFLWYEALKSYQEMIEHCNKISKSKKKCKAKFNLDNYTNTLAKSLESFWVNDTLCDRIVEGKAVEEFRPNAVIAAGLKHSILDKSQTQKIYERATNELLTDYGLRTITPHHHKFKRTYYGTINDRDRAYHQGTVWAWLLWPYVSVYLKLFRDTLDKEQLASGLEKITDKFVTEYKKGYIATIAAVWDGGKPHFPKGSPAQACSVAAVYDIEETIKKLRGTK